MRTAKWEAKGEDLFIWFEDDTVMDREGYFPILLEAMTGFLEGRPYVLEDHLSNAWLKHYVSVHAGPVAYGENTQGGQYVLLGDAGLILLQEHFARGPETSWISGLRLHVFESEESMLTQMKAWSSPTSPAPAAERHQVLFTLQTYADAECLIVTPRLYTTERLLLLAKKVITRIGCDWVPLSPLAP